MKKNLFLLMIVNVLQIKSQEPYYTALFQFDSKREIAVCCYKEFPENLGLDNGREKHKPDFFIVNLEDPQQRNPALNNSSFLGCVNKVKVTRNNSAIEADDEKVKLVIESLKSAWKSLEDGFNEGARIRALENKQNANRLLKNRALLVSSCGIAGYCAWQQLKKHAK